jgi:ubiquinol-cytochrome c reductase cytochrome b subunit
MASFVTTELAELTTEQQQQRDRIIAALSAEAALPGQREQDAQAARDGSLEQGREAAATAIKDQACTDCHKFRDAGELGSAPDLTGYGTREWLRGFLADPQHERFYGPKGNDRMPSFAPHPEDPGKNLLTDHDLDMLVRWLRGDDRQLTVATPPADQAK